MPGTDYRFTVGSAKEAVRVIRDHLGPESQVCSVKQVEGKGLSRFFSSPRLEVIARIPVENEETPPAEPAPSRDTAAEFGRWVSDEEAVPEEFGGVTETKTLPGMLRRAGFSSAFLSRVCDGGVGAANGRGLTGSMLRKVVDSLVDSQTRVPVASLGQRVAFIGGPGAGKTTALCKWLAAEVFLREKRARVLVRDGERPNIGGPLDVFCDVLGVPVSRTVEEDEAEGDERLYFDLSGVDIRSKRAIDEMSEMLDRDYVTGRVLVMNGAYEASILKETCRMGEDLGFTHIVFTHLDEVRHWGKLLETIVCSGVTPLFLSEGPDVAGGIEERAFDRLIRETFPFAVSGGYGLKNELKREVA